MSNLIFVYGTLKRGYSNNILLASCPFIGQAITKPHYRLYDCGPYPCLIKDEHGRAIRGEIYEVDDAVLRRLDRLEGVPFLYQRGEIELQNFQGPVIAYFYQQDVSEFVDSGEAWPREK